MSCELWYNGVGLHQLGVLRVQGEAITPIPDAAVTQRWRVELKVSIDFDRTNYRDNHLLYRQAREAVRTPHATLRWAEVSGTTTTDWVNQTARVVNVDFPEDPNAWGTYHQRITMGFEYEEAVSQAHLVKATYQRTGSAGPALELGNVFGFKESYSAARFEGMRDPRRQVGGSVSLRGRYLADPTLSVAARRTALLATKEAWMAEVNGSSGTLVFGDAFNKVVRVEDFEADIDQAIDGIDWTLSAIWTRFPDETNYAAAEFSVLRRTNYDDGYEYLTLSGSIGAPTAVVAQAKLALVRSSVLAAQGFTGAQQLQSEMRDEQVSMGPPTGADATNTDGDAYLRMSFSEEYRKRVSDVVTYTLRIADQESPATGLTRTTYSGTVVTSGPSSANAYSAAKAKAAELAADKYQLLQGVTLSAEYERKGTAGGASEEFVRLDFTYEYQRKSAGRVYLELTSAEQAGPTGLPAIRISGSVVADTEATARAVYAAKVRALYLTSAMLSEQTSVNRVTLQKSGYAAVQTATGEALDGDGLYVTQVLRLDFELNVHRAKTSAEMAMRYGFEVDNDYASREKTTTVQGSVWAPDAATAEAWLDSYLYLDVGLGKYRWGGVSGTVLGQRVRSRRGESVSVWPKVNTALSRSSVLEEYGFSETFRDTLTSEAAILSTELSESIQFAGPRYVTQAVLDGPSVVQQTGTEEGSRTVSGRVVALTEAAAMAWVRKQLRLPFPAWGVSVPAVRYRSAPQVSTALRTVELTDAVGRAGDYGSGYGVLSTVGLNAVEVSFSQSEVLPDTGWSE